MQHVRTGGLFYGWGTLIGPAFAGFAFDQSGSYTLPILAAAGSGLAAAAWLTLLPPPQRSA